jgi:hypothetical protein
MAVAVVMLGSMLSAALCLAQPQDQPNSSQQESLKKFLREYEGDPYPPFEKEEATRYSAALTDLKDDGTEELIVYITGRAQCGSGGCRMLILAPEGNSYRVIAETTITRPPIRVLATKSNGWHDIAVRVQGGGILHPYEVRLSFDGKTYPSNPTRSPARRLTEKVDGKVVVPVTALTEGGKPLYP